MTDARQILVERMATEMVRKYNHKFPDTRKGEFADQPSHVREGLLEQADSLLQVVLDDIEAGKVVEIKYTAKHGYVEGITLKQEFQKGT